MFCAIDCTNKMCSCSYNYKNYGDVTKNSYYVFINIKILSDEWSVYLNLESYCYIYKIISQIQNFIVPITGTHINRVESIWMGAKKINKTKYGTKRSFLGF